MRSSEQFIRSHYAKLSWKLIKHGIGVLTMTEEREGRESHLNNHSPSKLDVSYLETPIRP